MNTIVTESSIINKKGQNFTEMDYFSNYRSQLKNVKCPNCGAKGGLYRGFFSIGCYECFVYCDPVEIYGVKE